MHLGVSAAMTEHCPPNETTYSMPAYTLKVAAMVPIATRLNCPARPSAKHMPGGRDDRLYL
jgi:hypothetical protein